MIEILKQNKEFWSLFTKAEEYNHFIVDRYERFPYYLSKYKNILEPEVSKFLVNNGLNIEYPGGKKFAVCLTHDIDTIYFQNGLINNMYEIAKSLWQGQIKTAFKRPFYNRIKRWNPIWNFKDIITLEKKYRAKSSFYFDLLN